jgi:hypothetical protein
MQSYTRELALSHVNYMVIKRGINEGGLKSQPRLRKWRLGKLITKFYDKQNYLKMAT